MLVLGGNGLERELRDEGYDVVTSAVAATRMSQEPIDGFTAAGQPDAVVVGLDPNLTYARLVVASDSIRAGAHFIATNRDPVYPSERGLRPGAGSLVIALEAATGVVPVSIGKPAPYLLEAAAHAVGREPAEAIMIGDGIPTDLAAAHAVGARCILMLTGVTTRAEVDALPADRAADRDRRRRGRARRDPRRAWARADTVAGLHAGASVRDGLRRPPDALRHGVEDPEPNGGVVVHQPIEPIASDHEGIDGLDRGDRRGARPIVDERDLAEEIPGRHLGDALAVTVDGRASVHDDEERLARITLVEDEPSPVLKLASWARPAIWSIDGSVMPWNSGTARRTSDRLVMAALSMCSGGGRRPDPTIRSSTSC